MAETVDVPAVGRVDKKYLYIGGAAVAGIVAYAWWSAGSGGGEPVEELPVDVGDTGIPSDGYVNPAPGGGGTGGRETDPELLPPTTNAQWMQRAVERLEGVGYDPMATSRILGKYLGRQQVTKSEAETIRAALAWVGPVPVGTYSILLVPDPPVTPTKPKPPGTGVPDNPSPGTPTMPPRPKPPPTGIPTRPPRPGTPTMPPRPGPRPPAKPRPPKVPPYSVYIVRPGDTLSKIAGRYGTTVDRIWDFNLRYRSATTQQKLRARGKHRIYPGSTFWIPK